MITLDLHTRAARRQELTARKTNIRAVLAGVDEGDAWPEAQKGPRPSPLERAAEALLEGGAVTVPPNPAELRRELAVVDTALGLLNQLDAADGLADLARTVPGLNEALRKAVVPVLKWARARPDAAPLQAAVDALRDAHANADWHRQAAGAHGTARCDFDTVLEDASMLLLALVERADATGKEITSVNV